MNTRLRLLGVWCAAAFIVLWLIGFVFFAQWMPPLPPSANANEVAQMFRTRSTDILIGIWFCITTYLLIEGIRRQAQEELTAGAAK